MTIPVPSSRPREAKTFRNSHSQAVCIPAEFEFPGDRVWIRREGAKLIIEPMTGPSNIVELLAQWRKEEPFGPEDQFPDIAGIPAASGVFSVNGYPPDLIRKTGRIS